MNLLPLVIALQGIGYGSFLTAVQGLWPLVDETPQPPLLTLRPMAAHIPLRVRTRRKVVYGEDFKFLEALERITSKAPTHARRTRARRDAELPLLCACL